MKNPMPILLVLLAFSAPILAQQNNADDPVGQAFFSPELVMQNQQAISLTDVQRASLTKEMQAAQSEFMTLQWDTQKEMEKLKLLIEKETISEPDVLNQIDHVLAIENKIKKRQITLMVRIKNLLSHDQQEKLQKLKK
jgi:Spy/CpxP family protein refolding chaperone